MNKDASVNGFRYSEKVSPTFPKEEPMKNIASITAGFIKARVGSRAGTLNVFFGRRHDES